MVIAAEWEPLEGSRIVTERELRCLMHEKVQKSKAIPSFYS